MIDLAKIFERICLVWDRGLAIRKELDRLYRLPGSSTAEIKNKYAQLDRLREEYSNLVKSAADIDGKETAKFIKHQRTLHIERSEAERKSSEHYAKMWTRSPKFRMKWDRKQDDVF
jgi:hypothetical protein